MLQRAQFGIAIAGCVVLAVATPLAAAPGPPAVERVAPPSGTASFGSAVAGLDDVDGDGVADIVVGAPGSGHVAVLSGSTRTVLRSWAEPAGARSYFGWAVAGTGDLDRDGVPELVVGAPSNALTVRGACLRSGPCAVQSTGAGRAVVFSGASGAALRELAPPAGAHASFGASLTGAGDLSGDHVPDIVAGAPAWGQGPGVVFAFSGADGALLWSRPGPAAQPVPAAAFGDAVVATSDASGDGVADLLVPEASAAYGAGPGRVHLVSGADGTVVRTLSDPLPYDGDAFGACVAQVGDQDGDGTADHLIGEPGAGRLHVHSGGHGGLVRSVPLPGPGLVPGAGDCALAPVDDKDGDGLGDFWVGLPSARSVSLLNGTGRVLAAATGPSPEGGFGAPAAAVGDLGGDPGADVVVGDPTGPGGGAAYLVLAPGDDGRTDAAPGEETPRLHSLATTTTQPTTTTTQPTTTTTTGPAMTSGSSEPPAASGGPASTTLPRPDDGAPATTIAPPIATLPKPAGATASRGTLARTGGTDGPAGPAGLGALVLGATGLGLRRRVGRLARASDGP